MCRAIPRKAVILAKKGALLRTAVIQSLVAVPGIYQLAEPLSRTTLIVKTPLFQPF